MSAEWPEIPLVVAESGGLDETWTLHDADGTVVDLTGDLYKASVRASYDTSTAELLDITPTILDATAGQIQFLILETDAALSALANGEYVYDLFRKPSGAPARKIVQGSFTKPATATEYS